MISKKAMIVIISYMKKSLFPPLFLTHFIWIVFKEATEREREKEVFKVPVIRDDDEREDEGNFFIAFEREREKA